MFIDNVAIEVKAGDGGNGVVSFRREKYIDRGGPNGGDGGNGGDVVLVGSDREHTLAKFRFNKLVKAENGNDGSSNNKRGKSAESLEVPVPVGTQALDAETGELLADITQAGQKAVIACGGKGGFGNAHFKSSTRQAPSFAEKGLPGDEKTIKLELKLIADVALVGLPNAGKSTLLSVISNAKPEIAEYPFTTITPNLGVVDFNDRSILFADIPGLIENAHLGKGLGHEFLRHVERTRLIVHLIDVYSEDTVKNYKIIRNELSNYSTYLAELPEVVVLTKCEGLDLETLSEVSSRLQAVVSAETPIMHISSQAHEGLQQLLEVVSSTLLEYTPQEEDASDQIPVFGINDEELHESWQVKKLDNVFIVTGGKIEDFARKTYFDDYHSMERLLDILHKMGIMHELIRQGYEIGQDIIIGDPAIGILNP